MRRGWLGFAALGLLTLGIGGAVAAEKEGVYKERETLMKGFGKQMTIVKGVVAENKGTLTDAEAAAKEIAARADHIPSVFPQGTNQGESEALPVIWQQWDEFEAKARNMQSLAAKLASAAGSGDKQATLAAFGELGKNGCGGCHETFRKKKSS
ncbi:c-type cytochrome [Benzoatithermus flavus]|uniref:Cytochrome c n=1 Tax=Benzoatithermus flavus TaxID=3108223 RepID=A0ABU8XTC6_9PROT